MVLGITEDSIRERFANLQITVKGERTLIQKLLPVINLRERKLDREMLPISMFQEEDLEPLCMDVVIYGTLYDAFPQLDVVLTPNGLATVGNSTLSPASAARSEAARSSLADLLFQSQEVLLSQLRKNQQWLKSKWSSLFRRSLTVQLADLCALNPETKEESFEIAKEMQLKAAIEEDRIAQRYISLELMEHLRRRNLAELLSPEEEHVVQGIRDAVRLKIVSKAMPGEIVSNSMAGEILIDIIDYIRQHPQAFPFWNRSRVAQTFKDHRFKNERNSGGFFF